MNETMVEVKMPKVIYVLHIRLENELESYHYTFSSRKKAWEYAIRDVKESLGSNFMKLVDYYEKEVGFNILGDVNLEYSIKKTVLDEEF